MTSMRNPATSGLPALRCPKCAAEMATYERSGVVIDQCRECRGIYLDRGELERLVDAEGTTPVRGASASLPAMRYAAPAPAAIPGGYRAEWHEHDDDDDHDERRDRGGRRAWDDHRDWDGDSRRPSRRRSLLGELLEGFGD